MNALETDHDFLFGEKDGKSRVPGLNNLSHPERHRLANPVVVERACSTGTTSRYGGA